MTAKRYAVNHGVDRAEAIRITLAMYDRWPIYSMLKDNKVVRRQRGVDNRRIPSRPIVRDLSEEAPVSIGVKGAVEEKNFWRNMRKQFSDYVEQRLANFDGIEKADIKRDFENELKTVTESLRVKVHLRASRRKVRISFGDVVAACATLAMDPPNRGELPDVDVAKSRKRALAKEYHSDHSGTNDTNANLQAVLEAYTTLEGYRVQMKTSTAQGLLRIVGNHNGGNDE